jgi:hypothetical protein
MHPPNAVGSSTRTGTFSVWPRKSTISLVSSTLATLAIWLAFLFPIAQLVRIVDGIAAAIDPRLSVVGSLHEVVATNGACVLVALAAVAGTAWVARRARGGTRAALSALVG